MNSASEFFKSAQDKELFEHFIKNPVLPSGEEKKRVDLEVEKEYQWWEDVAGYATEEDIAVDVANGALVKVDSDDNFCLIMRLRNPELKDWQPYLKKDAYKLLQEVTGTWRTRMNESGQSSKIRLSVTNLTVSERYQAELIRQGKLATGKSGHTKGESFDIDGAGYYEEGVPINPRLTQDYISRYQPFVHKLLEEVLNNLLKEEKLNYIKEFSGTGNQSFHITRSPYY